MRGYPMPDPCSTCKLANKIFAQGSPLGPGVGARPGLAASQVASIRCWPAQDSRAANPPVYGAASLAKVQGTEKKNVKMEFPNPVHFCLAFCTTSHCVTFMFIPCSCLSHPLSPSALWALAITAFLPLYLSQARSLSPSPKHLLLFLHLCWPGLALPPGQQQQGPRWAIWGADVGDAPPQLPPWQLRLIAARRVDERAARALPGWTCQAHVCTWTIWLLWEF